jgi:hypothetical protein
MNTRCHWNLTWIRRIHSTLWKPIFKVHFNIIRPSIPTSPKSSFLSDFWDKILYLFHISHACYTPLDLTVLIPKQHDYFKCKVYKYFQNELELYETEVLENYTTAFSSSTAHIFWKLVNTKIWAYLKLLLLYDTYLQKNEDKGLHKYFPLTTDWTDKHHIMFCAMETSHPTHYWHQLSTTIDYPSTTDTDLHHIDDIDLHPQKWLPPFPARVKSRRIHLELNLQNEIKV